MDALLALVLLGIIWPIIFFAVLPWGVVTHGEEGSVEPGTVESAPVRPRLALKAAITTLVALIVWGVVLAGIYWWPHIRDAVWFLTDLETIWE